MRVYKHLKKTMLGLFVLLGVVFSRKSILARALNTHYQANSLTLDSNLNKSELSNHEPKNETSTANSLYPNTLNNVNIIYNEWEDDDVSLYEYYRPIYTHEHIRNLLRDVIAISEWGLNRIWGKVADYSGKIKKLENSCGEMKKNLSTVIENLENPAYNYQNKTFQNTFSLLKTKRADLIQCVKSNYNTLNNDIKELANYDRYSMYEVMKINPSMIIVPIYNTRIDLIKNEIEKDSTKIKSLSLNEAETVSNFINQIASIIENEPELKTNLDTIKFMHKQINHIIKLYKKYTENYNTKYNIIMKLQKIENAYKVSTANAVKYISDLGENYANSKYNYNILIDLDRLYNSKKTQMNNIFIFLTQILIGKVDPSSNKIVQDDIYYYNMSQPKEILNNLKDLFHKTFGKNVDSYDKNLDLKDSENENNDVIAKAVLLINQLEDLIKSMESIYNNDAPISEIQTEINRKTNIVDLNEKLNGFKIAIEEAKKWKTKKNSTISALKEKYEIVRNLQTQINQLYQSFSEKIRERKYVQESKSILKIKVEHINEKKKDLEKLIELKKDIENHINQINILLNNPLYEVEEYENKKNKINDDIGLEFKNFYNDDLENLVAECSNLIDDNIIEAAQNEEQIKKYLEDVDAKYNKINNIKFNEIAKVLNNVSNKKESLLELINEIKKYTYYHMINDLSSMLNKVQTVDEHLTPNMNSYLGLCNELKSYKEEILKKKNSIVQNDYINNGNYPDYGHDSKKLLEYGNNFLSKEKIILKFIEEMSKISDEVKTALPKYDNEAKKITPNSSGEYSQVKKIIEQIKEYTSEDYLNKCRKKLNDIKTEITDATKQIQDSNKSMENFKMLNNALQQYQSVNELVKNIINGKNVLDVLLSQSIQTIQNYDNVNEEIKNSSIETLNNKISMINSKLNTAAINDLETKLSSLKEYFISSKQKILENDEVYFDDLLQNINQIDQVQNLTNELNEQYISLKMDVEKSINDINKEIQNHQNGSSQMHGINEEIQNHQNGSSQMHGNTLDKTNEILSDNNSSETNYTNDDDTENNNKQKGYFDPKNSSYYAYAGVATLFVGIYCSIATQTNKNVDEASFSREVEYFDGVENWKYDHNDDIEIYLDENNYM
ncbi:reticulocyte binding protein, putative [Plasmodium vinckei brucechwatti]|uniref:Reticulocyte binding protein, putative n=1 Tax=Plasmodium vinckei brucechwatti TaxID=119398 RepID=A0A6V7S100_PLAVN|nr:reticulocyte binding protein, putative [Plasmodium vinckei brucechwatti]